MTDTVYLDGAQRITKILKDTFGDVFKKYFIGAPNVIPEGALPCVITQKVAGRFKVGGTMSDDGTEQIMVHVLANGKDGFAAPTDDNTVMRQLFEQIEGINPVTGEFKTTSFMHALRTNITLDGYSTNFDVDVNYDATPRPEQPTIYESVIMITIDHRVLVPNRT